jgi:YwiC-like protein
MNTSGGLFPKEHGAYGQIAFPLVTALLAGGPSIAGVLLMGAIIAGFLAHEPAAIVLGQRGARATRELRVSAIRWLCWTGAVGIAASLAAVMIAGSTIRWSFAVPAIPALLLAVAMINGREKSWYGETAAALAFAGAAVPVMMAAGAPIAVAWTVAIPFALLFTTTTLAVRVVILRVRGGGDPGAAAATRRATIAVCATAAVLIGVVTTRGWVAPSLLIATAPGLLTASIVAARPPSPAQLRRLGWSLVAVSTLTALILVVSVA